MSKETSKAMPRRLAAGWDKYLVGEGVDIGCGPDKILPEARGWDLEDGDAQYMAGVPDESFDWVYSSHCLEHMRDPRVALANWWRILRPNGYLMVVVPEANLYEQGHWPSIYNPDHKSTWTLDHNADWSPVNYSLQEELEYLFGNIISLAVVAANYDPSLGDCDRTSLAGVDCEAAIEAVVRKPYPEEWF